MQRKNLTYREFTSILIKFLKEHDALESYKRNCINFTKARRMLEFINPLQTEEIDGILKKGYLDCVFWNAFSWADSPQGDEYWRNMASEWDILIEDVKLCNEKI